MSVAQYIRTIPDYPKEGILFRDITTLLEHPVGFRETVDAFVERYRDSEFDLVAGIEARGFVFGSAIAYALEKGFVPLRKPGKLPGEAVGVDYELEYGTDRLEVHVGSIERGHRVLLVDDLIATGGTAAAAIELIEGAGATVVEACFVVDLPDLGGARRLEALGCTTFSLCAFEGE